MAPADPKRPAPRRRGPRRADAPGTGPASADGPEPTLREPAVGESSATSVPSGSGQRDARSSDQHNLSERERWLLEQRPPHWD
ncbi:hypothetical protein LG293_01190 [Citricoccus nitrophenolicus]|uniref:hypothetical protein n=1 Tax=Citricoccus muralis TaxID=169134 RepID=UPI000E253741|nr:hypothetical protein [Citricoccus muralis]